jgi:hypothetical protein
MRHRQRHASDARHMRHTLGGPQRELRTRIRRIRINQHTRTVAHATAHAPVSVQRKRALA